jgi:hypothetical protein
MGWRRLEETEKKILIEIGQHEYGETDRSKERGKDKDKGT